MTSLELKIKELAYRSMADAVRSSRIHLIKQQVEQGVYDEGSPLPFVADRITDTFLERTCDDHLSPE